jgi:hypothetical protein
MSSHGGELLTAVVCSHGGSAISVVPVVLLCTAVALVTTYALLIQHRYCRLQHVFSESVLTERM